MRKHVSMFDVIFASKVNELLTGLFSTEMDGRHLHLIFNY